MPQYTATTKILAQRSNESDEAFNLRIQEVLTDFEGADYPPTVSVGCHTYGQMKVVITLPQTIK